MARQLITHNTPVFDQFPPKVYGAAVGLVVWFALAAAKEGKSGSVLSQIFLLCYHYNPVTGRYGALILSVLRVASVGRP